MTEPTWTTSNANKRRQEESERKRAERAQTQGQRAMRNAPRRGRPTTCTPEVTRKVALEVAYGSSIPVACRAVGLAKKTAEEWLRKGREGIEPYAEFVQAMDEAKARWETEAVRYLAKSKDWKARAWLLERRAPQRYRPPSQRQEITGKDGAPLVAHMSDAEIQAKLAEIAAASATALSPPAEPE